MRACLECRRHLGLDVPEVEEKAGDEPAPVAPGQLLTPRGSPHATPPLRLALVTETFPPEVNGVARTLGRWVEAFRPAATTSA